MDLNQFENKFKLNTETRWFYCTIGFYTLLAFQRHIIWNFWINCLKDIKFQSFKQFVLLILIWKSFRTDGCHVATPDRPILFQMDQGCGPSDFKGIRQSRCIHSPSLSDLFRSLRFRSYGADAKGRGAHRGSPTARVPARRRLKCECQWGSGGLQRWWIVKRRAGGHGKAEGVVDIVDCFLEHHGEAAGGGTCVGELWVSMGGSFYYTVGQSWDIRGCNIEGEEE
jgi:hypothetical protein